MSNRNEWKVLVILSLDCRFGGTAMAETRFQVFTQCHTAM